ncbi:reverse transcriptase [Metarhizium robertsii ARSEF 23]|uniref:Reverse transcriptase n=1 Tax=Metarhizium robertsii (strain ARSEF 23 / ATCC MYA-3075) TaxID=655844 RepID=E9EJY8_METRA|nr:reverse transcriptase [Metarhizium robertsii ARSEF 23]EFZ04319.2 reverse transcriptase [Metarhizium robertsii ARSEF 23]
MGWWQRWNSRDSRAARPPRHSSCSKRQVLPDGRLCKDKLLGLVNLVQRTGAQAIVGTFLTVAASVVEADAHVISVQERDWRRKIKVWIYIHTLPDTNPLRRVHIEDSNVLPITQITFPPSGMPVKGRFGG